MGIFKDLFNNTIKDYEKIKINKKITPDELFEIVKNGTYPCGVPEIFGKGIMRQVKFPPVNKYMILIQVAGKTVTVQKTYSGVGGLAKEVAGDMLTDGFYTMFNGENLTLNQVVKLVAKQVSELLEKNGLTV